MIEDIRVYTDLRDHPKVRKLARALKISEAQAVGHLIFLWIAAAKRCPDGNITGWDQDEMAFVLKISRRKAVQFQDLLIFYGFIDVEYDTENNKKHTLHNWNIKQPHVTKFPKISVANSRAAKIRWLKEKGAPKECNMHYGSHCDMYCNLQYTMQCPLPHHTTTNNHTLPNHNHTLPISGSSSHEISGEIFDNYRKYIGEIPSGLIEELKYYQENCEENWIKEVFLELLRTNDVRKPWKYVKVILDNWLEAGEMETRNNGNGSKEDISPKEYIQKYGHLTKRPETEVGEYADQS